MELKIFRDIRACGEHLPGWKAIMDHVGETFAAKGYAKREYFEYTGKDIVENEAYMVVAPRFALLHSVPECEALENVFHFMKLGHPMEFGHESNNLAAYVTTFTSVGANSHIMGISLLVGTLMKEGSVGKPSRAGSDESLAACIREYEKQEKDMLKANMVCTSGMESDLILKMTVEKAFKELGIDTQVIHMDARQSKDRHLPDVCIIAPSLARATGEQKGMISIAIKNFMDVKTVKEKIREALNIEEQ